MEDMVLLDCMEGTEDAIVLCPVCGKISHVEILGPYVTNTIARLKRTHVCDICKTEYSYCDPEMAEVCNESFQSYLRDADEYETTVRRDYVAAPYLVDSTVDQKLESDIKGFHIHEDWRQWFNRTILERGEKYYKENRVKISFCRASIIDGRVQGIAEGIIQGTEEYSVNVMFVDGEVTRMRCDCPFARKGPKCKHEAAMLFELETLKPDGALENDKHSI